MDEHTAKELIAQIEHIIAKGDRAEIIPVKGGIRLARMCRKTVLLVKDET